LSITDNGNGYKLVSLHKDAKRKNHYLHRLVAESFVENISGKSQINHKDCNKQNNNACNLEWVSSLENIHHAMSNGLSKAPRGVKFKTNTSGYVGVGYHKSSKSFRVNIKINSFAFEKRGFKTAIEASYYYDIYSIIFHGIKGRTNHLVHENWRNYGGKIEMV